MRILCPSCAAAYSVPDSVVGEKRRVRCFRCQHVWSVEKPLGWPPRAAALPPAASLDTVGAHGAGLTDAGEAAVVRRSRAMDPVADPSSRLGSAPSLTTPSRGAFSPVTAEDEMDASLPAMDRLRRQAKPLSTPIAVRIGWVASLIILAAAIWAAHHWRTEIMQAWPPSLRIYALLAPFGF